MANKLLNLDHSFILFFFSINYFVFEFGSSNFRIDSLSSRSLILDKFITKIIYT